MDTIIEPGGWKIHIFLRGKSVSSDNLQELRNLLKEWQFEEPDEKESGVFILTETFIYDEVDLEKIACLVRTVVKRLANSDGAS